MKIKIRLDDPETRAVWETAQRARAEVEAWPEWKRGADDAALDALLSPPPYRRRPPPPRVMPRLRWLECDGCGLRRATVRTGAHVVRGLVFLFCLACRLRREGVL